MYTITHEYVAMCNVWSNLKTELSDFNENKFGENKFGQNKTMRSPSFKKFLHF